jgi:quercetin dioxygenase-like cupin family protein
MRRFITLFTAALAATGFMPAASASPPTAVLSTQDHGRAQATEAAAVPVAPDSDFVIASYMLAPGDDSGWRHRAGPSVLVVTNGTLTLRSGSGCTLQEYVAGQAVVVPAGLHRLSNAGDQPLALSGAFLDASANGPTPFIGGAAAASPAGCGGLAAHGLTAPSPGSVVRSSRGIVVGAGAYRHSDHAHYAHGIEVEGGKDILVTTIQAEPGSSSGWMRHKPTIGIITKGTLTYYEGHDGRCVKTGEFIAGQAYVHASPVTHMATNEGPETFEAIYVYFNLPHNRQPLPVISNLTDSIDFTPLPPKDCPRLR